MFGSVFVADQDACSKADPVVEKKDQRHQGVACTDGGERIGTDKAADDHTVNGVVGQLQQIAQHQRDRKPDQQRKDRAGGKILCPCVCHTGDIVFFLSRGCYVFTRNMFHLRPSLPVGNGIPCSDAKIPKSVEFYVFGDYA